MWRVVIVPLSIIHVFMWQIVLCIRSEIFMPLRLFFNFTIMFFLSLNKVFFFTPPALYFIPLLTTPLVDPIFLFSPLLKKLIHSAPTVSAISAYVWQLFSPNTNGRHRVSKRYVLRNFSYYVYILSFLIGKINYFRTHYFILTQL